MKILPSAQCLQQRRKDLRRRGSDVTRFEITTVALQVADEAAGLEDEQRAGGHVPGREAELPEGVEPSARDVREVERRGAGAPHAGRDLHHRLQLPRIELEALELLEGKAGADQGGVKANGLRHPD